MAATHGTSRLWISDRPSVADAGPSGADAGKGGKYLILPPGYASPVPEGYIALRPATFGSFALLRSNLKSHSDADVAKSVETIPPSRPRC
jgi:hypothetical protein